MADQNPVAVSDMLRGGNDPEAMKKLRARERFAQIGVLMGTQPTQAVGGATLKGVENDRDRSYKGMVEAADLARRQQEQAAEQARWDKNFAENKRQFALQEARLNRPKGVDGNYDIKDGWLLDKNTGQRTWVGLDGSGAGGAGGLPEFNPQRGKPTTQQQNDLSAIQKQRAAVEGGLKSAQGNPSAFGTSARTIAERYGGDIGAGIGSWKRNPQDTASRAFVLNNVSAIIKERAGAAQSAQELQKLNGYLPAATDDAATVEAKFNAFLDFLDTQEAALRGYSTEELGYTPRTGAGPRKPESTAQGGFEIVGVRD